MAFSFDEAEYADDGESVGANAVDEAMASFDEATDEEDDALEEDVESRLEAAVYYKTLLRGELFAGASTAAGRIVTKRVRDFVRTELRKLLGLERTEEPQQAAQVFTPDEVQALKVVAGRVLSKTSVSEGPQLRTVEVAPAAPKAPQLQPRVVGAATPEKPKAPKPKAPAFVVPPKSGKKPAPKKQGKRLLEEARTENDETIQVTQGPNGRITREYINADGKTVLQQDLTPQVRPAGAIPMPSPDHMAFITEQQATQTVAAQTASLGVLGASLVQTVLKT